MIQFLKTCTKCRKRKWNSEFYTRPDGSIHSYCNSCRLSDGIIRERKRNYGINEIEYQRMLKIQKDKCLICKQSEYRKDRNGNIQPLSVDHCHKIGKVRGLLCFRCNAGLGNFNDNPEILKQAAKYLEENQ